MPRKNRTTVHRIQRPKWARNPVKSMFLAADAVTYRTMNPRPDERGSTRGDYLIVALCTIGIIVMALTLTMGVWS